MQFMKHHILFFCVIAIFCPNSKALYSDELRIAVASNFKIAMEVIRKRFQTISPHQIKLIFGSTGKHYAQINHSAPFDAFFAADEKRPLLLEKNGLGQKDSRFTYAVGKLILWSPKKEFVDKQGKILFQNNFRHLSLANPKLAPYGRAAKEVLDHLNLWTQLKKYHVYGENINQSFQFIEHGLAELGFVAFSQIKHLKKDAGSYWSIPQEYYSPIKQQAIVIKESKAVREFFIYVKSQEAQKIIRNCGYGIL